MIEILILIALAIANGVFAATELAVISARRGRLQQRADEGDPRAIAAIKLQEDPNRFLSSVQVGITLIGTLSGVFAGATLADNLAVQLAAIPVLATYADGLAQVLVVGIVTYFSLVLGELVPKRLALQNAEQLALIMARPMTIVALIARPIIWLLTISSNLLLKVFGQNKVDEERVTEEDIRQLVREGAEEGSVEPHEQEFIDRIFTAGDRTVRAVMTPRRDVYMLDGDEPLGAVLDELLDSGFSRFPVYENDRDHIVGIAHVRDILRVYRNSGTDSLIREVVSVPIYVPENTMAIDLLGTFKKSQRHMAIVIDETGGTAGVVTLEDVLEEIVGEIADEYDDAERPPYVRREDGSLLVDGTLPIETLKGLLEIQELPDEDTYRYDTLAGLVISLLGQIPVTGETTRWGGWAFEVIDMDGLRIDKVLISREVNATSTQERAS
jgi:putative hemolysin